MRHFISTDSNFGNAQVLFDISNKNIADELSDLKGIAVAPGFIATNAKGDITTLGRGGSDYTAAIIAGALNAEVLEIWTDVDGFMTADPRKVDKAYVISKLSYAEALELSHFGAKDLYTPTLHPAYQKNIPIKIKNTFNHTSPGTLISKSGGNNTESPIKGISSINKIDLITIQGSGLPGVTGISMRLFSALARRNVNIVLITQASSEYSISFAISPTDTEKAVASLREEFQIEMEIKNIIDLGLEKDLSIIAIVGEKMKNTPGISANLFTSLGRNGISVIATAQGSSELNISVVIKSELLKKALNVIHEGFFLSHYKELHLYLAGTGNVGRNLLQQISAQKENLMNEHNLKINLIGISNSRKMILDQNGIDLNNYKDLLDKGEKADMDLYLQNIKKLNLINSVFIYCKAIN
jgi:aspartokinase/homoserine dehydrogenase 1